MNTSLILEKISTLEKRCQQNELEIKDKENMIYSLNKKIERIFLSQEGFLPSLEPKQDTSFSNDKMNIIENINSLILEICIKKMEEKAELIEDKIYHNLERLEKRIDKLESEKIDHNRNQKFQKLQEQGNQGEKSGKFEILQRKTNSKLALFEARLNNLEKMQNNKKGKSRERCHSHSLEDIKHEKYNEMSVENVTPHKVIFLKKIIKNFLNIYNY